LNRNAELQFGKLTLANDHKPIRRSALQSAALREVWRLLMNRSAGVPPAAASLGSVLERFVGKRPLRDGAALA
jgi:hypothetical protein